MPRDVWLARHAQASFGAEDYDALSELGHRQAAALGRALRERGFAPDVVMSGRMRRHKHTAQLALDAMGLKVPVVEDAGFDEYDHEDVLRAFEPRYADKAEIARDILGEDDPPRAFQRIFARAVDQWMRGGGGVAYREPFDAFRARVHAAMDRIPPRERVLVVTSGGPIFVACQRALGIPDERAALLGWALANASVTRLRLASEGWRLSTFNEHAHLEPDLVTRR